jgi:RNA polymerase sigma-70 factor, ECF subfamily
MSQGAEHKGAVNAAIGFADESSPVDEPSSLDKISPTEAVTRPSLQEIFSTEVDFVWRSLRLFGVREADLADQTQEVFIIAHRRFSRWDGEHVRAWLYAIARRCAAAYRRRSHHRHELSVAVLPESHTTTSDPSTRIELDRLDRALASLDEDKRAVFVLFEIEEMSMRDVARAVGCPVQTAYARLYAARRELTRSLTEER